MRKGIRYVTAAMLGLFFVVSPIARADSIAEQGRAILTAHQDAVITIQLVVNEKFSFSGEASEGMESIMEATGTVISPEGLTVVSLSETDPAAWFEAMMSGYAEMDDFSMDTDIRDVKMLMPDGREVEADLILRDKDLDMAFVRPKKKPESPMTCVNLDDAGTPLLLDHIVSLGRMGKVTRRSATVSVDRLSSMATKPRTFYIVETAGSPIGSPAFTLDGKLIGVYFIRTIKATGAGGMFGGAEDNIIPILLPAVDIAEAASQAPPLKK